MWFYFHMFSYVEVHNFDLQYCSTCKTKSKLQKVFR